jgi:hypothetical protein
MAQHWLMPGWLAMGIEISGALIMSFYMVAAIYSLAITRSVRRARFVVSRGAITGLNFAAAATALKLVELWTWNQIAMAASIFALRIVLKQAFINEQKLHDE